MIYGLIDGNQCSNWARWREGHPNEASNPTQQGVKEWSDEGPLTTLFEVFRSSFICSGYLGFFPLRDHGSLNSF